MTAMPVRTGSNFNLESIRLTFFSGGVAYHVRLGMIGLVVVGALVLSRLWCRYLCPLGALLAPANKVSLWRLKTDEERCIDCGKYPAECPVHTRPGTMDCTLCADCLRNCPEKAVRVEPRIGKCIHNSFRRN
jgi:polyferredoxin